MPLAAQGTPPGVALDLDELMVTASPGIVKFKLDPALVAALCVSLGDAEMSVADFAYITTGAVDQALSELLHGGEPLTPVVVARCR